MAAEQRMAGGLAETTLEARLDAIDQLLLGCLPRGERLAIVASLEEKLRSHCVTPSDRPLAIGRPFAETLPFPIPALAHEGGTQPGLWQSAVRLRLRRSRLALVSGILGIAGGALLFGTPLAYGAAALFAEMLDETIAIITLVAYAALILFASGGAILAGIVALWRLRRQKDVGGKGWAITGLCTGPIPLGITSLIALYVGIQTIDLQAWFGSGSDNAPASAPAAAISLPDPYPPENALPLEPTAPVRLASEPASMSPAPVELLAAPATMPPAAVETRPVPVAAPEPEEPSVHSLESKGLVE